ncbi:MAG TPA: VTT domain-containing protein [Blastocatellia bacterium]|nr:VTT domain-containing protein [Blastocatellia bacterium]
MSSTAFILLFGIKSSLEAMGEWLKTLGPAGLFGVSLVDSAGLPLPGGPDAVMILLTAQRPWLMPLFAVAATVGSTIGCALMYLVARRAGVIALKRVRAERRGRIENLLGRYDMFAIMVPAVLPPPFPFKPFVLSAGVFKLKISRFVTAIFIGRAARFFIEGWLAVAFGEAATDKIKQHGLKVLIAFAAILLLLVALKIYRSRRAAPLSVDEAQPRGE